MPNVTRGTLGPARNMLHGHYNGCSGYLPIGDHSESSAGIRLAISIVASEINPHGLGDGFKVMTRPCGLCLYVYPIG